MPVTVTATGAAGVELLPPLPQPLRVMEIAAASAKAGTLRRSLRKDAQRPICQTPPLRAFICLAAGECCLVQAPCITSAGGISREFSLIISAKVKLLRAAFVFALPKYSLPDCGDIGTIAACSWLPL